jgi:hypothetical protein
MVISSAREGGRNGVGHLVRHAQGFNHLFNFARGQTPLLIAWVDCFDSGGSGKEGITVLPNYKPSARVGTMLERDSDF